MSMRGLEGKRILVAGCARGIGKATAHRLAGEGARLMLGDIDVSGVEELASELGASWHRFDLVDADSIIEMVRTTCGQFGGLDGVANIAADLSPQTILNDTDLARMDLAIWDHTLAANLRGFALIIREALPALVDGGGGAIVNVSSVAARNGESNRAAYAASKGGVESLTRHVATRWGRDNVRANAVAPGAVFLEEMEAKLPEAMRADFHARTVLPRLG